MTMNMMELNVSADFGEKPINVLCDGKLAGRFKDLTEMVEFQTKNNFPACKEILVVIYTKK